jgi:hypothetical protein
LIAFTDGATWATATAWEASIRAAMAIVVLITLSPSSDFKDISFAYVSFDIFDR